MFVLLFSLKRLNLEVSCINFPDLNPSATPMCKVVYLCGMLYIHLFTKLFQYIADDMLPPWLIQQALIFMSKLLPKGKLVPQKELALRAREQAVRSRSRWRTQVGQPKAVSRPWKMPWRVGSAAKPTSSREERRN